MENNKTNDIPFPEVEETAIHDLPSLFEGRVTKEKIESIVHQFTKPFVNGEKNALPTYIQLKVAMEYFTQVSNEIKKMAMNDADRLHKMEMMFSGVSFSITQGAKKYSFRHNHKWIAANDRFEKIKIELKEIEDKMIKAMDFAGAVDEEGEIIPAAHVIGAGESSLRVTIPKT